MASTAAMALMGSLPDSTKHGISAGFSTHAITQWRPEPLTGNNPLYFPLLTFGPFWYKWTVAFHAILHLFFRDNLHGL